MGRHAHDMLDLLEQLIVNLQEDGTLTFTVELNAASYTNLMDGDRLTQVVHDALARAPFGISAVNPLMALGEEVIHALFFDIAEQQGTHLNAVPNPDA
jgi:hypothetical protein